MVLAIVLALIVGVVWLMFSRHIFNVGLLKIGFILLLAAAAIIRSLWVQFPRPEGIPITRDKAPRLFVLLDELTGKLKAPQFHHVLLDSDFNAGVVQRPKLGMLGWQENYLVLGLPLMQALPPEQFRAVVAHELGHLSSNHARFGGWIYRVAATWEQLQENFASKGNGGALLFEKFLNWYWPFFNAYSFVLRRADEYVADRCSSQLSSAQVAGDALININVKARFLETKFWPDVFKRAEGEAEPPRQTFSNLARAFREDIGPQDARTWASKALRDEASYSDTHPSLSQRLNALGYVAGSNGAPQLSTAQSLDENALNALLERSTRELSAAKNAATHYLAGAADELTGQLDEAWRQKLIEAWGQHHTRTKESKSALQELEARIAGAQSEGKTPSEVLSEEEMWNRARWTGELGDEARAIALLRELLSAHPDHKSGRYALGHLLLEAENAEGIEALEEAMRKEPAGTLEACMAINNFLKEQGRKDEAETYHKRAEEFYEKLQEAQRERNQIGPKDFFFAPQLNAEKLEAVRAAVKANDKISEAFLVRKEVRHFPEDPCYVLALVARQTWVKRPSAEENAKMVEAIAPALKDTAVSFLFVIDDNTKALGKAIRKIEGSQIYSHQDETQAA